WVRAGATAIGYHGRPEATAASFRDGWVVTGDRYRVAGGRYYNLGRDDDMLRVGAQWVSPLEVESVLLSHRSVAECAVVGRADADGLLGVCAYVVLREATPPSALEELFAERLARPHPPRWIEPAGEPPATGT